MKNYYLILGISPQANAEGVRRAFREKAKKYHPDKTGQEGTSFFQDITEAYEVLSDPGRRSEYNRKFDETEHRPSPSRTSGPGPRQHRLRPAVLRSPSGRRRRRPPIPFRGHSTGAENAAFPTWSWR
jgi:curved DNA-binding protein CbpA